MNTTTQQRTPAPATTAEPARAEQIVVPPVDVVEDEQGITLYADLPGVSRDGLDVKVESDQLTIEGSVTLPLEAEMSPLYAEVRTPRYRRSFTLSRELDSSRIEANLKDGVLKLRVNKHEKAQPRRIQVQVS